MRVLALGPFVGSLEFELLQFRPYCRWLSKAIAWDRIYLSTHANRSFLYNFVPEQNKIHVYQHFSRDEENQKGYIHTKIDKKDYNLILKAFKEKIFERENCNKKDIETYYLSYTKSTPLYSVYNKILDELPDFELDIPKEHENKILFIPAKAEKLEPLSYLYMYMKENHDILVLGNTDTWFSDDNVILNKIDYFENGIKYLLKYISKSKGVICPLSYWTGVTNMLSKPVFSWGDGVSQYRRDGIYNFGNKRTSIIPTDDDTDPDIIIKGIRSFIKEIER